MKELKYVCEIWQSKLDEDHSDHTNYRHFCTIEEAENYLQKQYLRVIEGLQIFGLVNNQDFVSNCILKAKTLFAYVYVSATHRVTSWKISKYLGEKA